MQTAEHYAVQARQLEELAAKVKLLGAREVILHAADLSRRRAKRISESKKPAEMGAHD